MTGRPAAPGDGATPGPRPFTVAGTVRRTFAMLGRNLPTFVGLALALSLLPQLAGIAVFVALDGPAAGSLPALAGVMDVLSVVHRGAAVGLALSDADGGRRSFGAAPKGGAALFRPNGAILVLVWLGVGLAGLALGVLGVWFLCRWIAAVPAEVAERTGVRGALARSRDLTAGHRWRVFGLLSIYAVPAGVAPFLLLFQDPDGSPVAKAAVAATAAAVGSAVGMVGQVGVAAIYAGLRAHGTARRPARSRKPSAEAGGGRPQWHRRCRSAG